MSDPLDNRNTSYPALDRHTPIRYEIFGWSCTCKSDWTGPDFAAWREHLAQVVRGEEAEQWRAKIEALIDLYKRTGWMHRDVPADLRVLLDGESGTLTP